MPYKRVGKCVYKKKPDGSKGKKAGTESSKESSLRDWFGRKGAKGKKKGCSTSVEKAKKYLKKLYSVEEIVRHELIKILQERKK